MILPKIAESTMKVSTKHVGTLSRKTSWRLIFFSYSSFFLTPVSRSCNIATRIFTASKKEYDTDFCGANIFSNSYQIEDIYLTLAE